MIYTGVVENRMDPLELGRCQVRIHGLHTHDKSVLPTEDLPWAYPLQSLRSAAMNGIGDSPNGVVEGTTVAIVFMDSDKQQPVMIGAFGGIPQDEGHVDNDQPPVMTDGNNNQQTIPVSSSTGAVVTSSDGTPVTSSNGTSVTTGTVPGSNLGTREGSNVKIATVCHRGIQSVAAAMDSAGITSPYARAAILGIIGGECDWVPQKEAYGYSRSRIQEVFSWMSNVDADKYATWKGSREDFFRFVYGPSTRSGKNLGNKNPDDGAMYYGRGFIQLTGAANYKRYAKLSGVDIVGNPDLLNDYDQGAKVAVSYFKDRVKVAENDPGYFDAACAAVGYNVPNIKAKKQAYYKYFLLGDPNASSVPQEVRNTAVPGAQPTTVDTAPTGLPADRQKNIILGFRDPHMKYPLRDKLNEPDTNRLARGRVEGTSVQTRDNTRTIGVPTADGGSWNQPAIPYNAKYPFNHVFESESGHLQEFDDTPDNERINLQHRSGTFTEVDCNGTSVHRIVGDGYEIIDRNGYVYVRGALSITSEGVTNIFVNADANIRVAGHTQVDCEQDLDFNVSRDFNLNIGGDWNVTVGGSKNEVVVGDDVKNVHGLQTIKIDGTSTNETTGAAAWKFGGDLNFNTGGALGFKIGGDGMFDIAGTSGIKSGTFAVDSGSASIKSGSPIKYTPGINVGAGASSVGGLGTLSSVDALEYPAVPELGVPESNFFDDLTTPSRRFEEDTPFETPDEISTKDGQQFFTNRTIIGDKSNPATVQVEQAPGTPSILGGVSGSAEAIPQDRDLTLQNMADFPLSLRLSDNYTLGDLIRNPKHVIANQMLKDSATAAPRTYTKQEIVQNLKGVAQNILEPIAKIVPGGKDGFLITSGYRYAGLTANESKTSDHPKGCAVDIVLAGKTFDYQAHYDLANQLRTLLPYDQIILEYRDPGRAGNSRNQRIVWIHISHKFQGARKMAFTMLNDHTFSQDFKLLA